jgi:uncharacterized protein YndB with AHSA1/START domain
MTTATTPTATDTDRIERSVTLDAPRPRVWHALTDAETFGTWFGANLAGQAFAAGRRARGPITITGFTHVVFDVVVDLVEPMDRFAFRWHPYAVDPSVDYAAETPTLVTFTLADVPGGGTRLTVVESGFDQVPAHRRAQAFRMNTNGWEGQLRNIAKHVAA